MITVTGDATLRVQYAVDLDMTEEEFDSLSERKQNELIAESIDWHSIMRNAEVNGIDVDDVFEA